MTTSPTADAPHEPDRMPSGDEEAAAEASTERLRESGKEREVAAHYEEMAGRGAEEKGEGRIE
ncbi:MAG: hypothetical protein ACRDWE_00550 [Acidimicrobiales bacterium]